MNIDHANVSCGWCLSCWVEFIAVPGRAGVAPEFEMGQRLEDASVVVTSEEVDDEFPFPSFISRTFPDGRAAAAWFRQSGHKIPVEVMRALRANDLKPLDDSQQEMTVGQRLKWMVSRVIGKSAVTSFLRGLLAHRFASGLFERVAG